METKAIDGLTLFFEPEDRDAADLIADACNQSIRLMHEHWGLKPPDDCRVYVLTSMLRFAFHAAPWPWRALLVLSMPFWYIRARRTWPYAGGYAMQYGRRHVAGVKPPRLMALADRSIGARVFVPEKTMDEKIRSTTCHELVHAFTQHLKLPMWLHEGVAMVTVDKLLQKPTVLAETLDVLARSSGDLSSSSYRSIDMRQQDAVVYHVVRGYWLTRYLAATQPDLLRDLLARRYGHRALGEKVAAACGMSHQDFWPAIDGILAAHFRQAHPLQPA